MATIEQNLQKIADDVSIIKTNLGLQASASLDDIVEKSETVIEPKGTINITENGTVDVSDYASATVNVSGGGDISEYIDSNLNSTFNGTCGNWVNLIKKLPPLNVQLNSYEKLFYGFKGNEINMTGITGVGKTTMKEMFRDCANITSLNLNLIDTKDVTDMQYLFSGCTNLSLINVSNFNTGNVTTMYYMFESCKEVTDIDISNFDMSKVKTIYGMFNGSSKLETVEFPNTNLSVCTNAGYMFRNCSKLKKIPQFDTSKITSINYMFSSCALLEEIPLLDFSSVVEGAQNMVSSGMRNLTTLGGFKDYGKAFTTSAAENYSNYQLTLSYVTNLTHDSLMNVINNLYDIKTKGCRNQKLSLGSTNLAKLTAEEIAIATNKGWNVA